MNTSMSTITTTTTTAEAEAEAKTEAGATRVKVNSGFGSESVQQSQSQPQSQAKQRPPLGHIATLYSGKGGSGKTTSTFHLGAALVAKGYKVLLVDWDGGQASLSAMANVDVTALEYGLYEAIRTMLDHESLWLGAGGGSGGGGISNSTSSHHHHHQQQQQQQQALRDLVRKTSQSLKWLGLGLGQGQIVTERDQRFAIIGNNLELAALESELADMTGREYVLQKFLARYSPHFDFTLIDPPANRGLLAVNALTASHSLILPVETSSIGLQATCSMLSHNKFLPRITGRSWTEEMERNGISIESWYQNAPFRTRTRTAINSNSSYKYLASEVGQIDTALDDDLFGVGGGGVGVGGGYGDNSSIFSSQLISTVQYPNARLALSAVIPTRYNRDIADCRDVLAKLEALFGNIPANGGKGRLMPPVPYSGTYQRSFGRSAVAQEMDSKRHAPIWDYIATYVSRFALHLLQKQQTQ